MNRSANAYFNNGCGRCSLGGTADCKVHKWNSALLALRKILHGTALSESCKWGVPCYVLNNKNVLLISAFKDFCCISFFKGSLMEDPHALLTSPGENSQAVRLMKFTDQDQILANEKIIQQYIDAAIQLEKSNSKVSFDRSVPEPTDELYIQMKAVPGLEKAFFALTPGRQRGYILFFSKPKKSATRMARIEKCIPLILQGKGLHDDYIDK